MSLINCPECNKEISDKAEYCINCGYPIQKHKYSLYIIDCGSKTSTWNGLSSVLGLDLDYDEIGDIVNNLPYKIFECDTIEESNLLSQKLESYYINIETRDSSNNIISQTTKILLCPKCNSDNIQILNKKWSVLTGFMTNKVNRVCVNCKYKF